MSAVTAFCERHGMVNMRNLLQHSGSGVTHMQEVFALNVLEELLQATGGDKMAELRSIRAEIHPVERAAKLRALKVLQEREIQGKQIVIDGLLSQIDKSNLTRDQTSRAISSTPDVQQTEDDEETQLPPPTPDAQQPGDDEETQPLPPTPDAQQPGDDKETQPLPPTPDAQQPESDDESQVIGHQVYTADSPETQPDNTSDDWLRKK